MKKIKILVIGGGGREHALCWKLRQSPLAEEIFCAPGNAGIARDAQCVPIKADDFKALADFAEEKKIALTIVGPEQPLVDGIEEMFSKRSLLLFGPTKAAARLEGSKIFAKEFMRRWNIPTADFQVFDDCDEAIKHIKGAAFPVVIKADGLAAGKGVHVAETAEDAQRFLNDVMRGGIFGDAGSRVIVEECLTGEELSIIAVSDGTRIVTLMPSQDHKRIFDDDRGPNTGGMGAYSPVSFNNYDTVSAIIRTVLETAIAGMAEEGTPFRGVLYAGLMLGTKEAKVLEFNVRFGDPETQVVLPMFGGDLTELCAAAAAGDISGINTPSAQGAAVCVVMASGGYPGSYEKGKEITGLKEAEGIEGATVFHAGTAEKDGKIVTAGGRVLGVTGMGKDFAEARERAYRAVEKIHFEGAQYRRDIGARETKRQVI
ncbi:MAG: phosphoribosylamine--glycine ligase [bacterium]